MGARAGDGWMRRLTDTLPSHQAPECIACGMETVAPQAVSPDFVGATATDLYCQACGHSWVDDDYDVVACAWWGAGGYEEQLQMVAAEVKVAPNG